MNCAWSFYSRPTTKATSLHTGFQLCSLNSECSRLTSHTGTLESCVFPFPCFVRHQRSFLLLRMITRRMKFSLRQCWVLRRKFESLPTAQPTASFSSVRISILFVTITMTVLPNAPTGAVLLAPSPAAAPTYDFMYYLKGAAAGGICCSITHGALTPVDVVKTRVQLDPVKVCVWKRLGYTSVEGRLGWKGKGRKFRYLWVIDIVLDWWIQHDGADELGAPTKKRKTIVPWYRTWTPIKLP